MFCSKATHTTELQKDFYAKLEEELIDNQYDEIGVQLRWRPAKAKAKQSAMEWGLLLSNEAR
jgi:hypothetical protein